MDAGPMRRAADGEPSWVRLPFPSAAPARLAPGRHVWLLCTIDQQIERGTVPADGSQDLDLLAYWQQHRRWALAHWIAAYDGDTGACCCGRVLLEEDVEVVVDFREAAEPWP
jgi:hypothetical protein